MTRAKMASFLLSHDSDESQDIPALLSFAFNSDDWDDGYGESSDDDDDDAASQPASLTVPRVALTSAPTRTDSSLSTTECEFNDDEKTLLREAADEGREYPFKDMVRSIDAVSSTCRPSLVRPCPTTMMAATSQPAPTTQPR